MGTWSDEQAGRPKFNTYLSHKKLNMMAHTCNLSPGKVEMGGVGKIPGAHWPASLTR